jgi:hypothetical protein
VVLAAAHQSGNPDATQYAPTFNGIAGWQLYHGPRYTIPFSFRFDEWFTVRILFAGRLAEIYMAVSEAFGGWGVQAKLEDLDGVTLV